MLLGATTVAMLIQRSCFLINLRPMIQNNAVLVTYFGKKEDLWKHISVWYKNGRIDKWCENTLIGILPEDGCKKNFRISRETFHYLVQEVSPWRSPKPDSPNYRAILATKKVTITLYHLEDTGSLSMTSNTFGIHISIVSKVMKEVCSAITYNLGPNYVQLCTTVRD